MNELQKKYRKNKKLDHKTSKEIYLQKQNNMMFERNEEGESKNGRKKDE